MQSKVAAMDNSLKYIKKSKEKEMILTYLFVVETFSQLEIMVIFKICLVLKNTKNLEFFINIISDKKKHQF